MTGAADAPLTYRSAGVDIGAGEAAVERIKAHVRSTFRPEVLGDLGGFGGLFSLGHHGRKDPVLVASTDGVGTKSMIARLTGKYDTIGIDLVAMSADDIAVQGAEPLLFLDYISVGRLDPVMADAIVEGVAEGCRQAGCALIGGEMSEHPDLMAPGEFDLVGFAVGIVDRAAILPQHVRAGDRIIGFESPGLRSNGYSLARRALIDRAGRDLAAPAWKGWGHSLGEELLRPSVIYAPAMAALRRKVEVHAFAHVTGGGIAGNLVRVLPHGVDGVVHRSGWDEPRIFAEVQAAGDIADAEMEATFNLGLGMLAVVPAREVEHALDAIRAAGHRAWAVGEIVDGHGRAHVDRA
ncbi:MAG: phosphoribosylformylglycinamidine cyclo-ligase [Actinomycetes bacterium]